MTARECGEQNGFAIIRDVMPWDVMPWDVFPGQDITEVLSDFKAPLCGAAGRVCAMP